MDYLLQLDFKVFELINIDWSNQVFDVIMPLLRNKYFWFPLYIFLTAFLLQRLTMLRGMLTIISLVTCVMLIDVISSQIVKKSIQRVRPCNEMSIAAKVNEKATCRYSYSFPSSHAANHFGMVVFLFLIFPWRLYSKITLSLWAFSVSFAQIYVGLHYPLDVLGGAILGIIIARLYYSLISLLKIL